MKALIEACLFATGDVVKPEDFAKRMGVDLSLAEQEFATVWAEYGERESGGLMIARVAGGYQMVTRPDLSDEIGKFLAAGSSRNYLSKPALETLAIIAYRQPATQSEIEAVRGVSVDGVLKTLADRELIVVSGRKAVPGRPILYSTTTNFLQYFGLDSLAELPVLDSESSTDDQAEASARHMVEMAVGIE